MVVHQHIFGDERPFPQCHAATICHLDGERFLAAWFGGQHEKNPDVAIWGATRDERGWSAPRVLAKIAAQAHWNPVLFRAPDGAVHLWFKVGLNPRVWCTWTIVSRDGGATWSEPRELVPGDVGGRGPVKNKPIVLSDGAWLAPASIEVDRPDGADWDVFVDRSEDGGVTWSRTPFIERDRTVITGAGVIQPTLWESEPRRVHLLCRSTCGAICQSDSDDGGRTWTPLYRTDLPNNNSGIDVARLPNGTLVLAYNPVAGDWASRTPLSLAVSTDNGVTWPRRLDLETAPGEYSYPSIVAVGETQVACVYTWQRRRVAFWWGGVDAIGE